MTVIHPHPQIGTPIRIAGSQDLSFEGCLVIQSTHPKEAFEPGGAHYGRCFQWGMNRHTYTSNPELVKEALGLTDQEYDYWLPLITF